MIVVRIGHVRVENLADTTMIEKVLRATWMEVIKINGRINKLNLHVQFKPTQWKYLYLIRF